VAEVDRVAVNVSAISVAANLFRGMLIGFSRMFG
jgi:hypothetical protein